MRYAPVHRYEQVLAALDETPRPTKEVAQRAGLRVGIARDLLHAAHSDFLATRTERKHRSSYSYYWARA